MTTASADQRPRLLVLASTYPRWTGDHEPGFVHELSKRLAADFAVTVLCPHAPGAKVRETLDNVDVVRYRYAPQRWERLVNDGGIVTNLRNHPWMTMLLPGFLLAQLIYALALGWRRRPQVIHAHWIIPQAFIAAIACSAIPCGPPIVATSHGADLFALNGWLPRRLKEWTLRRCAWATVVSHSMLAPLKTLRMPSGRTSVAPMGVDMSRFAPDSNVARDSGELLFVGRLVEKKGLRHLIDALPLVIARFPDVRLTVIGFGPELAQRQTQVRELGLQDRVCFQGAVAQDQLPALYRRAAMLVAPFTEAKGGDREGLGLVTVEALACGCPVVTTQIEAVKEVFGGQWPPYLASPGSPASLAESVCRVLDDPTSARNWATAQREQVKARFDWSNVARGYAEALATLRSSAAVSHPPPTT